MTRKEASGANDFNACLNDQISFVPKIANEASLPEIGQIVARHLEKWIARINNKVLNIQTDQGHTGHLAKAGGNTERWN
jgi:hypothetical protein